MNVAKDPMELLYSLESMSQQRPAVVTIGNFDGVHRGHQQVLERVTDTARVSNGISTVVTFSNHPREVLRPDYTVERLCTVDHKIRLIESLGIDRLVLLEFTKEFSNQTAEEFIERLQSATRMTHLILGHDAAFGRNKGGDPAAVAALAAKHKFQVEYLEAYQDAGAAISSSRIRESLREGKLEDVSKLLGRPFSIYRAVSGGKGAGKKLGFPTANLDVSGLCLPPLGVYVVEVISGKGRCRAVANLGKAPTLKSLDAPVLEAHLLDAEEDLYGEMVEVVFHQYLREELKFNTVPELQEQIAQDVAQARQLQL